MDTRGSGFLRQSCRRPADEIHPEPEKARRQIIGLPTSVASRRWCNSFPPLCGHTPRSCRLSFRFVPVVRPKRGGTPVLTSTSLPALAVQRGVGGLRPLVSRARKRL